MPPKITQRKIWEGIKSFFSFWKNFLVGDSPILALGVILILGADYLLRNSGILSPISGIAMVLVLMTLAVYQKTRHKVS